MEIIDFLIEEAFISGTLLVLILLLIFYIVSDILKKYNDVDINAAINLMDDKNLTIIDVRESKERIGGHIANDKHIPMAQIKSKLNEFSKNNKVLVYCRSGSRSAHICSALTRAGLTQVYNLRGGFVAWQKANLPIKYSK